MVERGLARLNEIEQEKQRQNMAEQSSRTKGKVGQGKTWWGKIELRSSRLHKVEQERKW